MRLAQLSPEFEKEMKSHSFSNNQFDGSFGPSMVKTVKKVQALAGLKETGEIDMDTLNFLNTNICTLNKKIVDIKNILK
jgi:murein L,D-transpeptidase YcbB/YkuD